MVRLRSTDVAVSYALRFAGLSLQVISAVFKAYLVDQSMDQLGSALRRGGVKDLLVFLPINKRDPKTLEEYFKKEGLPQVAEYFTRKQFAAAKESIVKTMKEMVEDDNHTNEEVCVMRQVLCIDARLSINT